ncbi:MAG: hypothetical protein HY664_03855 [Chloroflexi bacterium]|nr:hypothetical protein [Chloroflexota bacterium]
MKRNIGLIILALMIGVVGLKSGVSPAQRDPLYPITRPYTFDLVGWELGHFFDKWVYSVKNLFKDSRSEEYEVTLVEDYFARAEEIASLESKLTKLDPKDNSGQESLQRQLAPLKGEQKQQENDVEAIIEKQIGQVLRDEGLYTTLSLPFRHLTLMFPPVDFELGGLPQLLITSPRYKIEVKEKVLLRSHLSLEEIEAVEDNAERELGLSALVVSIGGFASYPVIIPEATPLPEALSTIAHEWLHGYFFFRPLGQHYDSSYEMTTINETAADIGGQEIGSLVWQHFYAKDEDKEETKGEETQPAFDFNKELREIRQTVDNYLSRGEIEAAETFMREKRDFLASKGLTLRKLNQAYFAFYGSYADDPASVSPIGGQLARLRQKSLSLGEFIKTVAKISRPQDLGERLEE